MLSIRFSGQNEQRQGSDVARRDRLDGAFSTRTKDDELHMGEAGSFEMDLRDLSESTSGAVSLDLVGFKVVRRAGYKVHFCTSCDSPIAVYGQMVCTDTD